MFEIIEGFIKCFIAIDTSNASKYTDTQLWRIFKFSTIIVFKLTVAKSLSVANKVCGIEFFEVLKTGVTTHSYWLAILN